MEPMASHQPPEACPQCGGGMRKKFGLAGLIGRCAAPPQDEVRRRLVSTEWRPSTTLTDCTVRGGQAGIVLGAGTRTEMNGVNISDTPVGILSDDSARFVARNVHHTVGSSRS